MHCTRWSLPALLYMYVRCVKVVAAPGEEGMVEEASNNKGASEAEVNPRSRQNKGRERRSAVLANQRSIEVKYILRFNPRVLHELLMLHAAELTIDILQMQS